MLVSVGDALVILFFKLVLVCIRIRIAASPEFLVRIWKTAVIVILIAAAVLSPTADVLNMMLFAAPMLVLYLVSIFVAWIFNKPRTVS